MIDLKQWKVNQSYNYAREVEPLAEGHDYHEFNMNEDECYIGKSFVTVSDDNDNTLSFGMDGWNTMYGASMELIFKG